MEPKPWHSQEVWGWGRGSAPNSQELDPSERGQCGLLAVLSRQSDQWWEHPRIQSPTCHQRAHRHKTSFLGGPRGSWGLALICAAFQRGLGWERGRAHSIHISTCPECDKTHTGPG